MLTSLPAAILCASLATSGQAQPPSAPRTTVPAFFNGEALLAICERPNAGQCSMYVAGVVDGLFLLDGEDGQAGLCRGRLNNVEAADLVVQRLRSDSTLGILPAAAAVRDAVSARLSCVVEHASNGGE